MGDPACSPCPANTGSEAGSDTLADCSCLRGFTGPNGASCLPCAPGSYKNVTGNVTCSGCAAGTYTSVPASFTCTRCPSHAISSSGSIVLTACMCNIGYSGPDGGLCRACTRGTFKHHLGNSVCVDCPFGSTSDEGSDNITDCECSAGYTGRNGVSWSVNGVSCDICRAGTFKLTTGNAVCKDCQPGTFKNVSGPGECSPCPVGSSSPAGSSSATACTCQPGFAGGSPPCTACEMGKFQNMSGLCVPCSTILCEIGQYREDCFQVARSFDAICYKCSVVENAVFLLSDDNTCTWRCADGFQRDCRTDRCEICKAGEFYQTTRAVPSCEPCPKDAECDGSKVVVCRETHYLSSEEIRTGNNTANIQKIQACRECPEGALICPNRGCFFPRRTKTQSGCDLSINMTVTPPIGDWSQDSSTGVWGLLNCPPGYEMISLYSKPAASSGKAQRCQKCVVGLQV